MPSAYVIESDQPNAFATGRNPENAAVAATSGLQRLLSEQELAGVVAHELAQIHDRETLVVTTMAAIAGAVSMLANFGLFFDGNRNKPLGLAGPILAMLLALLAAMLVQAAISCTREFAADKDGAATCGHPIRLDRALERLDEYAARTHNAPAESIPATAYLLVVNPLRGSSVRTLFSTHPRTEERVHRLCSIAGTVRPSFGGSRFLFVSASCRATARRAREALVWKDRQPSRESVFCGPHGLRLPGSPTANRVRISTLPSAWRGKPSVDGLSLHASVWRPAKLEGEGNMRIALLGCGRIGRMHADNLTRHPNATLAMVHDIHRPSAEEVASSHGVLVAGDSDQVFSSEGVDAVLVASSTETHVGYIEMSVAAGKPVLCEKPIHLDLDRVNLCAERIRDTKVPIQIGFNRRFDPGHRAARQAVIDGEIGELHQVVITSRDPSMPPRAYYEEAGGLLRDMTIHDFDLARYMLGEEPEEVFAVAGRMIDKPLMDELDDHDTAMILMRTASGKQCHINNSRTAVYGYDQRVELMGTRGMLHSGNRKPHELQRFTDSRVEAAEPYLDFFIERYVEAFMAEIDAFISSIVNGTAPEPGFDDGRQALRLAEAAYLSLREKRLVRMEEIA